MADFVRVPETDWQNILDATRAKTGGTEKMVSGVVADAIAGIASGGSNNQIASILDGTITEFEDISAKTISISVFGGCKNLAFVSMPNLTSIGLTGAFSNCIGLRYVNFPKVQILGSDANNNWSGNFQNTGIERLYLPEVTHIGRAEFNGCAKLIMADLPKCKQLWGEVFNGCSMLETMIIRNTAVCGMFNSNAFTGTPIASGAGYIYVPSELVDRYKAATNWAVYASQIRAIEDYPEICGEVSE